MPRIDEPRPPGVSRTSTYGGVPAVLGAVHRVLDELLRDGVDVVVEVRGENARRVSGRRIVPSENTRRRHERRYSEREGKKSPQNGAWHRCKDSISGGSPLLPANGSRATLDFRAPTLSPSSSPCLRACWSLRARSARVRRMRRRSTCGLARSVWRRRVLCRGSRLPGCSWRGSGPSGVADTLDRRPLERLATLRRPRPRTAPTRDRRSGGVPAGASGIRSGSGRRIVSRHAWSGTSHESERSSCGAPRFASRSAFRRSTGTPPIMPRLSWGADESIRRGPPTYAPAVRFAIVHHTAGRNDYSRAEAAAIVKGIQLFHVQGNGWNDIGYNFLVDRFGTIYEGRFGGIDRNVVGAHALGFNTGSVGIALLGTYGDAQAVCGGTGRDRAAHRVAARPRARRSHLVPHVHLRRKRAVRERHSRAAERGLGSP